MTVSGSLPERIPSPFAPAELSSGAPVAVGFQHGRVEQSCTECAGLLRFADSDGRRFTEYGSLGFFLLPPAGVRGRSPQEMLEAAWTWRHADFLTDSAGVCSRCSAKLETSVKVCESHDASAGMCDECERRYALRFDLYCPNCNYDPKSIAPGVLLSNTELLAFLTAHGINPFAPDSLNRASQTIANTTRRSSRRTRSRLGSRSPSMGIASR